MKALEVTTTTRIRDPHRPPGTALTQNDTYKASDGYALELHPSGLAVFITGRDHTRLAPIASAIVVREPSEQEQEQQETEETPIPKLKQARRARG